MANQNQVPGKIPALRTYAQDLEDTRHAKNIASKVVAVDEPSVVIKVAAHHKVAQVAPIINKKSPPTSIKRAPEKELIDVTKELNTLNTKIIVDNEDAASATVITDTKRDRFKLFPAILSSLNNWFSNQKKSRREKAVPKYTIPQTIRRKGLIQKATSNTGKTVTADFNNIQERVRQRSDEVVETEEVEGKIIWTPDTEPGFLLLEKTSTSPIINVWVEPRKSYYKEMPILEEIEDQETDEDISRWDNQEETPATEIGPEENIYTWEAENNLEAEKMMVDTPKPEVVVLEVAEPAQVLKTAPLSVQEVLETDDVEEIGPQTRLIPPKPKLSRHINNSLWRQLHDLNTNTLALLISAFILLGVASIFVIQIFLNQESETIPNIISAPPSLLLNTNLNLIINSSNNGSNLITSLNNLKPTGQEIVQAVFMEAAPDNTSMLPVVVLNLLGLDVEKNLAQSISELRFGFTSEGQPFILMKVPNTIVATGGLFLWEENLYADLSKIFVLDPIPQSSNLNFSDSTFAGRDVRLIKQPSRSELLIYGLINNTVIITTTSSSYRELSILIK